MMLGIRGPRFLESTRGQLVSLLRRGARTIEELAAAVGLTDNAVRSHVTALERDGMVRSAGTRRAPRAGKPAVIYELHPDADALLSSAYAPVLEATIAVMLEGRTPEEAAVALRQVGNRLARSLGDTPRGDARARVTAAANLLAALGGDVEVLDDNGVLRIRGCACPLSSVVAKHPSVCQAVESLVSEVVGLPATTQCEHGDRPRCCFAIGQDPLRGASSRAAS
jgi:predicted ArsR family transcriptional regulator